MTGIDVWPDAVLLVGTSGQTSLPVALHEHAQCIVTDALL